MKLRTSSRLFVVPALVALGTVVQAPGASAVIGGSVSTYAPWAVRMVVDDTPFCTATAIGREWILSASHCFFEAGERIDDSRIRFRVGALDQRKGTVVRPVPGSTHGVGIADMMLIKVPPMDVEPARLPARDSVRPGQIVRQYGWGATCQEDETTCQSDVLKEADQRVLAPDQPRCERFTPPGGGDGRDLCLGRVTGVPGGGDSGGPVMATGPGERDIIVAVENDSDRDHTAGAGNVSLVLDEIHQVIGT
ncbi:trypsin [Amycolatopsis thailandensis]|uniref:Trypsin n=1 Tax=Amycolatopsis thailandensis TaxID=589330 RepID=A0A229RYJ5_9PSEU|nr:trypsin-like serine protease [Amycolatopsis thailandensis]OXM51743.1 trypsin [Amycolatopsis thailandensis]